MKIMKTDKSEIYLGWIADNYNKIKEGLNAESLKCWNVPIDCDIYHDTILKTVSKVKDLDVTFTQLNNYLFVSYKTNFLREKNYARNKYRDEMPEDYSLFNNDSDISEIIDYEIIKDMIIKEFGNDEWELFERYIEGDKVAQIEKDMNESGLYYRFNKIKKFCEKYIKKGGN